jgi:hypothetical protein
MRIALAVESLDLLESGAFFLHCLVDA